MGTESRTKYACHWNTCCWTNGLYWGYLHKYGTGAVYKSKSYIKTVVIMKLQFSMKYSFCTLDTHSILHTWRYTYMLKRTVSYWFNLSKPLLSSKNGINFFHGIKHSESCQFQEPLEAFFKWFISCPNQLPHKMECFSLQKTATQQHIFRLLHFVFIMKYLRLKK